MQLYQECLDNYQGDGQEVIAQSPTLYPEDNATIIFTSGSEILASDIVVILTIVGTTGLPKGVLSTQRQFLTNVLNVCPSEVHLSTWYHVDGHDL